jgi:hypothetical protein
VQCYEDERIELLPDREGTMVIAATFRLNAMADRYYSRMPTRFW